MSQFKWGGRFNSLDKIAGRPVSGMVAGQFDGTFATEQEHTLKMAILMSFQDLIPELPVSLTDAISNLNDISTRLTEKVADELKKQGASGQITVVMIKPQ